jgi:putative alpha-1,2-mannosidase
LPMGSSRLHLAGLSVELSNSRFYLYLWMPGRHALTHLFSSVNDFALHQVAKGLGNSSDAAKYLNRSHFWRNHWNPNSTSLGFSGFLVPRNVSSFLPQDPLTCGGCYWGDYYYEALPWEYSFNAHHDIDTLWRYPAGPTTSSSG